jgi:hypothetical protein
MSGLPGSPTTDANGYYSAAVMSGWSGTATPGAAGYTFSPTSRSYSNLTGNQTGQDYTGTVSPCSAVLITPASAAIVSGPPTFTWVLSGSCSSSVYFASSPIGGNMAATQRIFSSGTNSFTQTQADWQALLAYLGSGPTYYWTVGSTDVLSQVTYADWRPLKVITQPKFGVSYVIGGNFQTTLSGLSFGETVVLQVSSDLKNWTPLKTNTVLTGSTLTFTNTINPAVKGQYFRAMVQ